MNQKLLSESDYRAEYAVMLSEDKRRSEILSPVLEEVPSRPKPTGNIISDHAAMKAHLAKLQTLIGLNADTARRELISRSTAMGTVPVPGAATNTPADTNANGGAAPVKATSAVQTAAARAFNPDAAILAARGAKSYAELSAMQLYSPDSDTAPGAEDTLPAQSAKGPATGSQLPSAADGIGRPGHVAGYDPDQAILSARGVSSLEELNQKYRDGRRIA